jgi:hypothetical protein
MREVTLFWKRHRLRQISIGPIVDILQTAVFLGYVERNPKVVRIMLRIEFLPGMEPHDLNELDDVEVEETLSEPTPLDDSWMIIMRVQHPLTLLSARVGKATIRPGSRIDNEGLHYIVRGSPISVRIIVNGARMMLRPDRISASGVSPEDLSGNRLLSERQMGVLQAAHAAGWYDIPRRITLGDLARELELGRSTVSEHLVRAEAALIDQFLNGDPSFMDEDIVNGD